MRKVFRPLRLLKQIDSYLLDTLSRRQLTILLLLVVLAGKNNGRGEFETETIKKFADKYFSGEDLFAVCQTLKRFNWGRLTCCNEKNSQIPPCLTKNWRNLHIGVEFSDWMKNKET